MRLCILWRDIPPSCCGKFLEFTQRMPLSAEAFRTPLPLFHIMVNGIPAVTAGALPAKFCFTVINRIRQALSAALGCPLTAVFNRRHRYPVAARTPPAQSYILGSHFPNVTLATLPLI